MPRKKIKLHKIWKTPAKWAMFGLAMGIVLATVGSIGAFNGWFGGGGSIPSDTLTRGLVGYWPMDEGSGGNVYDSSDYANNGSTTPGVLSTWTKGKVGGALSFDGTNDSVSVPSSSSFAIGTGDFTYSLWVKFNAFNNYQWLVGAATGNNLDIAFDNLNKRLYVYLSGGGEYFNSWTPATGNWYYVLVTRSAGNLKMYIDGTQIGTTQTATNSISQDGIVMGKQFDNSYYLKGLIDEVRIYNRALSAEEIRYHYNRGGPVGYWKFDEGEGRTAYDSTDNNNDGTLVLAGSATSSAWVAGKSGSALSFDGVDDYVDSGNVSSNARTVSFWLKRNGTADEDVMDLGTPVIKITGNAITSTGLTSPTYYVDGIAGATAIADKNWHFVSITDTADISASNIDIGKSTSYFNGLIDDVRIYNYARSPEEIRLDYNQGFAARFGPQSDCKRDPGSCMTQGLVGYWNMDGGSGGVVYDSSDYANNGSTTPGVLSTWTKGKVGGALSFDGTNDSVSVPSSSSFAIGTGDFTYSLWVKFNAFNNYQWLVGAATGNNLDIAFDNLNKRLYVYLSGGGEYFNSWTPATGNWYYVLVTRSAGNLKMYIDGTQIGTTQTATNSISQDGIVMGKQFDNSYYLKGLIDEVRIYNRALSAEEIRYHYNRGGPVGYWKFDEGEGRTAYDSTDNNNDGTLVLAGSATSSAWVAGKSGSALSFDGVDDYVDSGNVSSNARTVSFWLKRNGTADEDVMDLGTPVIKITGNAITSTGLTSPTYYVDGIAGATAIADKNWHFVSITDTADISASNIDIGKSTSYFNGLIDEVRIYNYARTPEQILQDYNSGFSTHFK